MKKGFWILLPIILVLTSACSIFYSDNDGQNESARTYPEALELEATTIYNLKKQIKPPDSEC